MIINFIHHQVTLGLIEVRIVATADNIADVLTKPLAWSEFAPKAAQLLGIDIDDFLSKGIICDLSCPHLPRPTVLRRGRIR